MKKIVKAELDELITRYPALEPCRKDIEKAFKTLVKCYDGKGKLLIAGNGGSSADSEHIAGELMKCFKIPRPVDPELLARMKKIDPERGQFLADHLEDTLRAIPLVSHSALMTAYMNDEDPKGIFAQQVLGYGDEGDVFLGISSSGNSENVIQACVVAKAKGMKIIGLTGEKESLLSKLADVCIRVPVQITYKVQEYHLPIYHCLCIMLENHYYG